MSTPTWPFFVSLEGGVQARAGGGPHARAGGGPRARAGGAPAGRAGGALAGRAGGALAGRAGRVHSGRVGGTLAGRVGGSVSGFLSRSLRRVADQEAEEIAIMTSKYEAFGLVVVESLQSGTPVIISKEVGAKNLVGKEEGLILNERTPESIKSALIYAAS